MRTPLPLVSGYFAGLVLGGVVLPALPHSHRAGWLLVCLGLGSALALYALEPEPRPRYRHVARLAPLLLTVASLCLGVCAAPEPTPVRLPPEGVSRLRVRVENVSYGRDGRARSQVRVLWGQRLDDAAQVPPGIRLTAMPFPMPEGAVVTLLARVRPSVPFRNPSPHPQLSAGARGSGIARLLSPAAIEIVEHPWPARWLDALRSRVRARLVASLPADVEAVARTLLLGDPDALEDGDADAVRTAGLSHVFAVSGMHVTLLAGIAVWLLQRALLRWRWLAESHDVPRWAAGLGIPLALSIAAFTGGAPSGWRASITTALAWAVVACGRRPDPLAVSALACLMFAAITPAQALQPGFLLSVAATAALISRPLRGAGSRTAGVRALIALNVRTIIATAPVVWWSFGSLSLVGLLANLLLVPVGSLLLLLTCVHAWLACLAPLAAGVSPLSAAALSIIARAFLRGAGACAGLDPRLALPVLTLAQGAALATAAGVWLFVSGPRRRALVVASALALCAGEEWRVRHAERPSTELRASFVDVGQGDAALVDLPDGKLMLIDAGGNPQGGPDPGTRALLPLLSARRRERLDIVVITHPHPDHFGGLSALIEALPIGELWINGQGAAEADFVATARQAHELTQRARGHGARVLGPEQLCGRARRFAEATVRTLAPCPRYDPGRDPNDNSLVLRIEYAGRSLLFAGDIEGYAEQKLVAESAPLRADVLKVPHHGSRTSSSESFLHAVQPRVAIISAGAWNPFGHPHPDVLVRLRRHARQLMVLGEHGGSIVRIGPSGELSIDGRALP